jgi:hypothetical protein
MVVEDQKWLNTEEFTPFTLYKSSMVNALF